MLKFKVSQDQVGERLDVYACSKLPKLSRGFVHRLSDQGLIKVNSKTEKISYHVRAGDKVEVDFDPKSFDKIPDIKLPIIYEDDDCLVINKPPGILTHSKGAFNPEATVATFIKPKLVGMEGERAGIVHRLDRGTSGVVICAKTPDAMSWLQKQFSQRKTKKTYVAAVSGHLKQAQAIIDVPLGRHPRKPQIFRADPGGKSAVTEYKVIKQLNDADLLELHPTTGRTHQLRVHLSHLGHPILGDTFYGGPVADRLYLHAVSLELTLPNKDRKVFNADLPKEFQQLQ